MLKYVETKNAPAAIGPYSQGIICNGIAFFSGQIPLSPITGEVVGTTIEEQEFRRQFRDSIQTMAGVSLQTLVISLHSMKSMQNILQENRRAPALL